MPTADEDARINAGIASDPDTFEPTDAQFATMFRFTDVPEEVRRRRGRPPVKVPKVAVTIRMDPEIVEQFRASGKGWQTRMNEALRTYLDEHPLSA